MNIQNTTKKKILLAGGGSGGPVQPVLAVAEEIRKIHPDTEFLFVGTKTGPEKQMVEGAGLSFVAISAAKFRRYFSIRNLFIPISFCAGFFQSMRIVRNFRPDIFFSAGGYVAVPLAWAAKIYGVKVIIHQQDALIGLANKMIAPLAFQITTAFEKTTKDFYAGSGLFNTTEFKSITWVGNPVRTTQPTAQIDAKKYFNLHDEMPILLVLGGATGAKQINDLIQQMLPDLVAAHQVVHQTGKGKNTIVFQHRNYHPFELLPFAEYASILKLAHLVVTRAGLSTIAELSAYGKPAVVIPMPRTHQEENAKILEETRSAVVITGTEVTAENLSRVIQSLKFNQKRIDMLESNISRLMPKNAAVNLAKIILKQ